MLNSYYFWCIPFTNSWQNREKMKSQKPAKHFHRWFSFVYSAKHSRIQCDLEVKQSWSAFLNKKQVKQTLNEWSERHRMNTPSNFAWFQIIGAEIMHFSRTIPKRPWRQFKFCPVGIRYPNRARNLENSFSDIKPLSVPNHTSNSETVDEKFSYSIDDGKI